MVFLSFGFFLLLFLLAGLLASLRTKSSAGDYFTTDRTTSPLLIALSAIATNYSGYVFIGQVGFIYEFGLHAIWITVGWKIGDFMSFLFVHQRFRMEAGSQNANSYLEVLSKWGGQDYALFRRIAALIAVMFLCVYAAAQLNAGAKTLFALFDLNMALGATIGAVIILAYSAFGGMRASIWTDAIQSFVIFGTLCFLLAILIIKTGGVSGMVDAVNAVSPAYTNLFPQNMALGPYAGPVFFVMGWILGGLGTIGQPQIMSRFLALNDAQQIWKTRAYYYTFSIALSCLIIPIALCTRVILNNDISFDQELALPMLASELLPDILLGVFIAGVFAATLSTADSQVLAASASLSNDFSYNKPSLLAARISLFFIILVTLAIAVLHLENVWNLVMLAWAALSSAFAPIVIVLALGGKPSQKLCIAMMIIGLASMIAWRFSDYNAIIYSAGIGIICALATYGVAFGLSKFEDRD